MTQLTREALEEALAKLASKNDLAVLRDDLIAHIDASVISVKNDVAAHRSEMNVRLDAMLELLDVRSRVKRLEQQVTTLLGKR